MSKKNFQYTNVILNTAEEILNKAKKDKKIQKFIKTCTIKPHFIPLKYRIFNCILQSMNIQFGDFLERLITNLIKNDERYLILDVLSGKKQNNFNVFLKNDELIDQYINNCQYTEDWDINNEFLSLQNTLINRYISLNGM